MEQIQNNQQEGKFNSTISISTLNVNNLNIPVKDRDYQTIKKEKPTMCGLKETNLYTEDIEKLK